VTLQPTHGVACCAFAISRVRGVLGKEKQRNVHGQGLAVRTHSKPMGDAGPSDVERASASFTSCVQLQCVMLHEMRISPRGTHAWPTRHSFIMRALQALAGTMAG